ncbi:MAG: mechanosensitive ion channel family protein [Eubacteriales bacterium]|nr:mechanosensitive ion channel family protein [Eubacteriales bacterium]
MKYTDHDYTVPIKDTLDHYNNYARKASFRELLYVFISAFLCIIIIFLLAGHFFLDSLHREYDDCINDMRVTMDSVLERYSYSTGLLDYETQYLNDSMKQETEVVRFAVENTPRSGLQAALDVMTSESDNVEFYYYEDGEFIMESSNSQGLPLIDRELRELFRNGTFTQKLDNGIVNIYFSSSLASGRVVTMYRNVGNTSSLSIRDTFGSTQYVNDGGILIYNITDGSIISSTNAAAAGAGSVFSPEITVPEQILDPDEFGSFSLRNVIDRIDSFQVISHDLDENHRLIVWHSMRECFSAAVKEVFVPVLYFMIVLAVLVIGAAFVRLFRYPVRLRNELIHIAGKLYIDKTVLKRASSLATVCILMICVITSYISMLTGLSIENIEASRNLDNITAEERFGLEEKAEYYDYRDSNLSLFLDKITRLIEEVPAMQSDSRLAELGSIINASEITLFSNDLLSTYSSTGFSGVSLGYKDEIIDQQLELLITGEKTSALICIDESKEVYDYITRRRLHPGFIRFRLVNDTFSDYLNSLSRDAVLIEADFGSSDKLYYYNSLPDRLMLSRSGSSEMVVIDNTLSESELKDGYFGIRTINNLRYYINVRADSNNPDCFFISAQPLDVLLETVFFALSRQLISCAVILAALLIFYCPCIVSGERILVFDGAAGSPAEDSVLFEEDEGGTDNELSSNRKMLRSYRISCDALEKNFTFHIHCVEFLCIAVFILFVIFDLTGCIAGNSLVRYLLLSDWQKGFNIFSLTMIFIISAVIWAVNRLLCAVILSISSNMGPSGLTLGRLIVSLIRLISLLLAVVLILSQLGVNAGTLLASAGLASVVIGIGAQSTVNDILSGLFIIFEGNFRVGDIVSINGWVGMIREIGARTTCIESYGLFTDYKNIRVINNSSLNDITNLSRLSSMAIACIPVAYESDTDHIEKLLQTNAAFIRERLPEILEGPFYDGIIQLMDSAKLIRIRVRCDEASRTYLERKLLQICTEILESNGVTIPYNQLVLHIADTSVVSDSEARTDTDIRA